MNRVKKFLYETRVGLALACVALPFIVLIAIPFDGIPSVRKTLKSLPDDLRQEWKSRPIF